MLRVRSLEIRREVPFEEITSIDAELYNTPAIATMRQPVSRFRIPAEHNKDILRFISSPRLDTLPSLDIIEIGCLKLEEKNGRVRTVPLYWTGGKSPINFSLNGMRCVSEASVYPETDDALTLDRLIRKIHAAKQLKKGD